MEPCFLDGTEGWVVGGPQQRERYQNSVCLALSAVIFTHDKW